MEILNLYIPKELINIIYDYEEQLRHSDLIKEYKLMIMTNEYNISEFKLFYNAWLRHLFGDIRIIKFKHKTKEARKKYINDEWDDFHDINRLSLKWSGY